MSFNKLRIIIILGILVIFMTSCKNEHNDNISVTPILHAIKCMEKMP